MNCIQLLYASSLPRCYTLEDEVYTTSIEGINQLIL